MMSTDGETCGMPASSDAPNLVTFEDLEGYRTVDNFGYVSGSASRPRNRLRATFRSLGMLIGLASTEFLSDAEQLRGEALEALRRRAESLGANAVIGLQFYVTEGGDGSCKVVAFGKAVSLSSEDPRR
jgi:uncharacterized protein YbjQ (UPF0145 family)